MVLGYSRVAGLHGWASSPVRVRLSVEVRALPRNRLEIAGLESSTFPV